MAYNAQRLGDLEYLIDRYCEDHINPIFDQTVEEVKKKSLREHYKALAAAKKRSTAEKLNDGILLASGSMNAWTYPTGNTSDLKQKWDWTKLSDDEIVNKANDSFNRNKKIAHDLNLISSKLLSALYGDASGYTQQQIDFAEKKGNEYLQNRIYQNFVRHAAKYNIPKSKTAYIFRKIWNDSFAGSVVQAESDMAHDRGSFGAAVDEYADQTARRKHNIGFVDDAVAYVGSATLDALTFGGFGGGKASGSLKGFRGFVSAGKGYTRFLKNYAKFDFVYLPVAAKTVGGVTGFVGNTYGWKKVSEVGDKISSMADFPWTVNHTAQQQVSWQYFGGYYNLDDIEVMGKSSKGHDMAYLNAISSELMNKTDLRSEKPRVESAIRNAKNDFLRRTRGSNQQLRKLLRSEMGLTPNDIILEKARGENDYLWTYDTWMRNLSWQQCRNLSAYWAGAYHYMKVHGEKERNFSGKVLTLEDVGASAMKYCNAADAILSEKRKEENLTSSTKSNYSSLRQAYDSHSDSVVSLVRKGLFKVGLSAEAADRDFPSWMLKKNTVDYEKFALYFIARAEALKAAGKSKEEYQAAASKAWQYAMASQFMEKDNANRLDKSKAFNACQQQIILSTHGSNLKLLNIAKSEVQKVDKSLANSKTFSKGMMNCSWENLHRQAVYWTSVLRSMRENNRSIFYLKESQRNLTRRDVADRAMRYCNAAAARLETDQRERKTVEQGRRKILSYQSNILRRTRGSNSQEQKLMIADFSKWGKHKYSKAVPSWMTKMKWEDCHRQAAYYYGVAKYVRENHLSYYTVGKQKMSFDAAAQRAYSYSLAAVSKLSAKQEKQHHQQDISGKIVAYKNDILRRTHGSNYQEKNIMAADFSRWGKKTFNSAIPKWMGKLSWETCHNNAAYYYGVAKYIKEHKLGSLYVDGKKMTFDSAAQLAWSYSKAAIENLGNKKIGQKFSKAVGYEPKVTTAPPQSSRSQQTKSQSSSTPPSQPRNSPKTLTSERHYEKSSSEEFSHYKSNSYNDKAVDDSYVSTTPTNGKSENQNVETNNRPVAMSQNTYNTATQNTNTVTYGTSPAATAAGYKFSTPSNDGWFKYLSGLGLNGFSDVTHNMGYVLAMLPDLLISIFTGKANFSLKNNLLPLSLLTMGILMPKRNRMLKMLLMGLGGAQLLNNAGHRILGQNPTLIPGDKTVKRYTTYADEPLDPRIKDPVLKADERLLMMDIDGVPYVIGVSGIPIDAYNKKALPLNVLANAVLRQFDEKKQQAEENMANNLSEQQQETQEKELAAKVK